MAMATVPASKAAMANAGLEVGDIDAVKTHNPFLVNDIYLGPRDGPGYQRHEQLRLLAHLGPPPGTTGHRLIMEPVEELALKGGGIDLFTDCADDSGVSLIVQVETGA